MSLAGSSPVLSAKYMKLKQSEILKLQNLEAKAKMLSRLQDKLVEDALKITKEDNEAGYTFDYILNYLSLDDLLERLNNER